MSALATQANLLPLLLAGAASGAFAQDALIGKRLYYDAGRTNGAGISCVDCHGAFPGALHGIGKAAGNPGAISYALGAIPQMARLRGHLSTQDLESIAAYLAAPGVPSPRPALSTSGPAANPYSPERLEFDGIGLASTVRVSNAGELPFRVLSAPRLGGPQAAAFEISGSDCMAGTVLGAGESCSVRVAFRGGGRALAQLAIPHDWIGGGANLALLGRAGKR